MWLRLDALNALEAGDQGTAWSGPAGRSTSSRWPDGAVMAPHALHLVRRRHRRRPDDRRPASARPGREGERPATVAVGRWHDGQRRRRPCISQLPSSPRAASLAADGSPCPPGVSEPVTELGAPSARTLSNPNSRSGRRQASPHSQGRVMERSSAAPMFVGIDVAKDRLDVHLRPSGEAFARRPRRRRSRRAGRAPGRARPGAGGAGGHRRLRGRPSPRALAAAGLPLAVVNPRQIRDFARATGRLAKTDRLDAEAIARFAEAVRPEPRPLPDAAARRARRAGRPPAPAGRDDRQREPAPPPAPRPAAASAASRRIWPGCTRSWPRSRPISTTRSAAAPAWRAAEDLLASVPGHRQDLGPHPDRRAARARQPRSPQDRRLVGVAPINRDSGAFRGRRMVMGGRASVRTALYMPTLTAIRRNPAIRALYQRLIARGKPASCPQGSSFWHG